jgi:23S rRNA pseudouridine2605 synthase
MKKTSSPSAEIRLNRYIAQCGIASRRHADELIEGGKVQVNGRRVFELGVRINPETDKVTVEGRPLHSEEKKIYVLFNKPKFVLSSMSDPTERPTVGDFFKKFPVRVFPVGRLDWDSEGMLLLTNDGEFSNRVAHPTNEVPKTYLVKVDGKPNNHQLEKLKMGVSTAVGKVRALDVKRIRRGADKYNWLLITIDEGRNRQIRRMFEKIGYDVLKLQRVSIGSLSIGKLKRGEFRVITPKEALRVFKTRTEGRRPRTLASTTPRSPE